jgi:hypothetical protein
MMREKKEASLAQWNATFRQRMRKGSPSVFDNQKSTNHLLRNMTIRGEELSV